MRVARMDIGIDLGSTYSAFAKFNHATQLEESLAPVHGDSVSIPSVVSISRRSGQITCGKSAKDLIGSRSALIFEAFKMLLLEKDENTLRSRGYDPDHTPRQITKYFLESNLRGILEREAENGNHYDGFNNVFICMPELWANELKALDGGGILREILLREIDIPINNVQVVTEPEAASAFIAFNYERETHQAFNGHLLLIDYGGGTLDITLTQVESDGCGGIQISYKKSGGAGSNHLDQDGAVRIGRAGIAFMQNVLQRALRDQQFLGPDEIPDFSSPQFTRAVRDLESQLKNAARIKEIASCFGEFGPYRNLHKILREDPIFFTELEYGADVVEITFQHLFLSYREVVEEVLRSEVGKINPAVAKAIGADPCHASSGSRNDFKIALVGGFGSFYLVQKQLAEIYNLDHTGADKRMIRVCADKREQAISLGAALLAAKKLVLCKTARYSIGIYSAGASEKGELHYGIKCHQTIEPGERYFLYRTDAPGKRVVYGSLLGNITAFAIEFSENLKHGGLMKLKPELLERMKDLPEHYFWNLAFSMDQNDVVTLHIVPCPTRGIHAPEDLSPIEIRLESYSKMFDITAVTEVTI